MTLLVLQAYRASVTTTWVGALDVARAIGGELLALRASKVVADLLLRELIQSHHLDAIVLSSDQDETLELV
jgi:hypothetical protein